MVLPVEQVLHGSFALSIVAEQAGQLFAAHFRVNAHNRFEVRIRDLSPSCPFFPHHPLSPSSAFQKQVTAELWRSAVLAAVEQPHLFK